MEFDDYDPFQYLRMSNLFGSSSPSFTPPTFGSDTQSSYPMTKKRLFTGVLPPAPQSPIQTPPTPPIMSDEEKYAADMGKIYGTKGPAQSAYIGALSQQPNRADYKPGVMSRIGAALTGFGAGVHNPAQGYEAARNVLETPYNRAMSDYSTRLKGLDEAAKLERFSSEDQLKALSAARALGLNYEKFKSRESSDKETLDFKNRQLEQQGNIATGKLKVSQARADAYIQDKVSKKYKEIPQRDGSIIMINMQDPSDVKHVDADTIAAGNLRVREMNAGTAARRATIGERAQASTEQDRLARQVLNNSKFEQLQKDKKLTPQGMQKATDNVLRVMVTDPRFAKYVKPGTGGFFEFQPDDGTDEYQDFMDEVHKRIGSGDPLGDRSKSSGFTIKKNP